MKKIKKQLISIRKKLAEYIPDRLYLKCKFIRENGKRLNLKNPQTFSEKMQWLKLYDRKPEYTTMVDKYAAKKYVAEIIGEEYIVPLLGVWERFEDIDFSKLPDKFALKCTHDSGVIAICTDKAALDFNRIKEKAGKALARDYYLYSREWPYKNVPHRIIAETYIGESGDNKSSGLIDYKFFCFNGVPKFCAAVKMNYIDEKQQILVKLYDTNWEETPFQRNNRKSPDNGFEKPKNLKKMIEFSKILSKDIRFVRVDWYETDGKLYFGELTFYPQAGYYEVSPDRYNKMLGDWLDL